MFNSLAYFLHNVTIKITTAPYFIFHNKKMTEESVIVYALNKRRKCSKFITFIPGMVSKSQ